MHIYVAERHSSFGEVLHSGVYSIFHSGKEAVTYSCLILSKGDAFEGLVTEASDSAPEAGVNRGSLCTVTQ